MSIEAWDKDEYGYAKSFIEQIPEKSMKDLEAMHSHMLRVIENFPNSPYMKYRKDFVNELLEEIETRKKYIK